MSALHVADDPESLTQFVHHCRNVTPEELLEYLKVVDALRKKKTGMERCKDDASLYGLLLALGEFELNELPQKEQDLVVQQLSDWYARDPNSGIHGATGWLLRHWGRKKEADIADQTPMPFDPEREWFTLETKVKRRIESRQLVLDTPYI